MILFIFIFKASANILNVLHIKTLATHRSDFVCVSMWMCLRVWNVTIGIEFRDFISTRSNRFVVFFYLNLDYWTLLHMRWWNWISCYQLNCIYFLQRTMTILIIFIVSMNLKVNRNESEKKETHIIRWWQQKEQSICVIIDAARFQALIIHGKEVTIKF